jgi:two-component system sporulation sensor kinase A
MGGVPDDFAGKTLDDLYGPDRAREYMGRIRDTLSGTETRFYEDQVRLPAGVRWFSSAFTSVRDVYGEVTGVQVISTDITDRVLAEQGRQESEERYRVLVDHVPDAILVHRRGIIEFVNPAGAGSIGYTPEEIIGTPVTRFIHPGDLDRITEAIKRRMKGEAVPPYEIEVLHKSGQRRSVMIRGSMIDLQGSPAILNVITDITDWKAAEQALRENEERFRHISSLISDFAYSCRKHREIHM